MPARACVDHPDTIDLSRIASALGKSPDALRNVPLPGHDHIITDRNADLPEWWPVYVVGVTDPASFREIEHDKDYATLQRPAARRWPHGPAAARGEGASTRVNRPDGGDLPITHSLTRSWKNAKHHRGTTPRR